MTQRCSCVAALQRLPAASTVLGDWIPFNVQLQEPRGNVPEQEKLFTDAYTSPSIKLRHIVLFQTLSNPGLPHFLAKLQKGKSSYDRQEIF